MRELRIHGRGGQGAVIASKVLAVALFREGRWVQSFPAFGVERRGAPVTAFLRVADAPIRLRCEITAPDDLIVLDPTLVDAIDVTAGLKPGGGILINTDRPPTAYPALTDRFRVATVDASAIAARARHRLPVAAHRQHGDPGRVRDLVRTGVPGLGVRGHRGGGALAADANAGGGARGRRGGARWTPRRGLRPWRRPMSERPFGAASDLRERPVHAGEPHRVLEVHPAHVPGPGGALQSGVSGGHRHRGLHEPAPPGPGGRGRWTCCSARTRCRRLRAASVTTPARSAATAGTSMRRWPSTPWSAPWATWPWRVQPPCAGGATRPERVAIVGAGPAGLACGYHLARLRLRGHRLRGGDEAGGMLRLGIPAYRLPRDSPGPADRADRGAGRGDPDAAPA